MLKTLKLAGYLAVALSVCGIGAIVVLGLKGDPKIREFLDQPGITKQLKEKVNGKDTTKGKDAPLVAQAQALALRFDPPPPPKPAVETKPTVVRNVPKPEPPQPVVQKKVQAAVKFDLLATVVYDSVPEKSMALLQTTGNKQEWFRQGEKLGYHEIKEIRNGSVVFTQGGQRPQEIFVPASPPVPSILKSDNSAGTSQRKGPGTITVQQGRPGSTEASPATVQVTDSGTVRMTRPAAASQPQRTSTAPTRRVRSVPPQTPEEQKQSIETSISGVREIMSQVATQDISEAEKQQQQESFKKLLEMLNAENKRLEEEARKKAVGREKPDEHAANNQNDANSEDTTETDAKASQ